MQTSWTHFAQKELQCRCGCGRDGMDRMFMNTIEMIRVRYKKPMIITSAYRCPEHNSDISHGSNNGPHTIGCAIDVAVYGTDAYHLLSIAIRSGITGVGLSQEGAISSRFIHLDMAPSLNSMPRPWVWTY